MKYKINFRWLVAGHIIVCVLLLVVLLLLHGGNNGFIKGVLVAVGLSLLMQVLVFRFRPTWFDDKGKTPGP